MLMLRQPPDFTALAAYADTIPHTPSMWAPLRRNRRNDPRRSVSAAVYLGVVPARCNRSKLPRIPVSVFKPLDAGWAIDLSVAGISMLAPKPVEVGQRHWLRLDHVALRPTIVPARVLECAPLDEGVFHVRFAFTLYDDSLPGRLGFEKLSQVA